jgi:asparagine synthase (glutamine-hydrolysing)
MSDLRERVERNFSALGMHVDQRRIRLETGLFADTLCVSPPQRIALAHVDCDWYEPVKECLEAVTGRLSPGGFIVVDDYHDYDGCRWAVHDFLSAHKDLRIVSSRSNLVLGWHSDSAGAHLS